jgi:MFS family permease
MRESRLWADEPRESLGPRVRGDDGFDVRERQSEQPLVFHRNTIIVWLLGLTQIIGFGTIYYAPAILAGDVSREFGWTQPQFFGGFSIALAVSGLVSPFVGKAFDTWGAARLMVLGSVLCAAALLLLSMSSGVAFVPAMVALQVFGNLALYDAAFTSLVQANPQNGSRRIAYLTLIAGFASTIFWPLTTWLLTILTWRETVMLFAALNLVVCGAVHLLIWTWSKATARDLLAQSPEPVVHVAASLPDTRIKQGMALVAIGFTFGSMALSAVLAQMVPLLGTLGFGAASLWVATLFGPAQVVVRFTNLMFGSKNHPLVVTIFALTLLPVGLVIAAFTAPAFAGAVLFVILVGMCSGLKSIVQGTLPLKLFGSQGYGARLGLMASSRYVAGALSPFAFSWIAARSNPELACLVFAGLGFVGVLCFVWLGWLLQRWHHPTAEIST